jgi:predicted nucleic acid-binding protein
VAKLFSGVGGVLVLDAEGLLKLAKGDAMARSYFEDARGAKGAIVAAASTLTEVLRGVQRDASVYRILSKMTIVAIDRDTARAAGELLGRTGLAGHRCALDSLVATVARAQSRPVVLLTSDTKDMKRLTDEPERPRQERIVVIRI